MKYNQGGLSMAGVSPKETESFQDSMSTIQSVPGGMEMLMTIAAQQGGGGEKSKQVRLFDLGGPVAYEGGGLVDAAERLREGGRGDDDVLLHVSPEEFEAIQAMWGPADINPDTGLPEYGFLSKVWKKVKKAVKKVVKSPLFGFLAPLALNVFAPGLGGAIGGALGVGSKAAPLVGNTLIRAGTGALSGGKQGALAGALSGLTSGGVGAKLGSKLGLSGTAAKLAGDAALGGAGSVAGGGSFGEGALSQAMHSLIQPKLEAGVEGGLRKAKNIFTGTSINPDAVSQAGGSIFPSLEEAALGDTASVLQNMGTGIPTLDQVPLADAPTPGFKGMLGRAGEFITNPDNLPGMLTAASMLQAGMADPNEGLEGPPGRTNNSGFGDPLPELTFDRSQQDPIDYYTYGRVGSENPGEQMFFGGNQLPSTQPQPGTSPLAAAAQTQQGGTASYRGFPIPYGPQTEQAPQPFQVRGTKDMLRAFALQNEGWRFDQNTMTAYPPEGTIHAAAGGHTRGPGSGRSDDIEAMLSDGEYVMDAETVSLLGDGSNDEGARRLDQMREELRKHKGGALSKGQFSPDAKSPMQYLAGGGRVSSLKKSYDRISDDIRAATKKGGRSGDSETVRLYQSLKRLEALLEEEGVSKKAIIDHTRKQNRKLKKAGGGKVRGVDNLIARIKALLEDYSEGKIVNIDAVRDPENPSVAAARVVFEGETDPVDFVVDEAKDVMDGIEEVEFTEWPPTQSKSPNPFYAKGGKVGKLDEALERLSKLRIQKELHGTDDIESAVERLKKTRKKRAKKARGGRMRTARAARTLRGLLEGED